MVISREDDYAGTYRRELKSGCDHLRRDCDICKASADVRIGEEQDVAGRGWMTERLRRMF